MLKGGEPIQKILKYSKLTLDKIEELKKDVLNQWDAVHGFDGIC